MALYYDLQVYKDRYRLTLLLLQYTKDFPKEYKYSLGEDIRRDSIVLVRNIYRANKSFDKTPELDSRTLTPCLARNICKTRVVRTR